MASASLSALRDTVKRIWQDGDEDAIRDPHLYQGFALGALRLSDVIPALTRILSRTVPVHAVPDLESVAHKNARAALFMLTAGIQREHTLHQTTPPQTIVSLCISAIPWLVYILQGCVDFSPENAGHVVEVETACNCVNAFVGVPGVEDVFHRTPHPAQAALFRLWVKVSALELDIARPYDLRDSFDLRILLCLFGPAVSSHLLPNSMRSVMESHAYETASTLVHNFTAQTGLGVTARARAPKLDVRTNQLLTITSSCFDSPVLRRALAAHGILPILCQMLRRAVYDDVTFPDMLTTCKFIQLLLDLTNSALLRGPEAVSTALEGRYLVNVVRVDHWVQVVLESTTDPELQQECRTLRQIALLTMGRLQLSSVFASCAKTSQKSLRYIDRTSVVEGLSDAMSRRYKELENQIKTRAREFDGWVYWICANHDCPNKAFSFDYAPPQCSRCGVAEYCGWACQKIHWDSGGHKEHCGRLRDLRLSGSTMAPLRTSDLVYLYTHAHACIKRRYKENLRFLAEYVGLPPESLNEMPMGARRAKDEHPDDWAFEDVVLICTWGDSDGLSNMEVASEVARVAAFIRKCEAGKRRDFDRTMFMAARNALAVRGPLVVLLVADKIVDITNWDRIKARAYSCEVYV